MAKIVYTSVWLFRTDGTATKFDSRFEDTTLAIARAHTIISKGYVSDNWTVEIKKD